MFPEGDVPSSEESPPLSPDNVSFADDDGLELPPESPSFDMGLVSPFSEDMEGKNT